jgi:hypothetical protein
VTFGIADMNRYFLRNIDNKELDEMWAHLHWAIQEGYRYTVVIDADDVKERCIKVEWHGK